MEKSFKEKFLERWERYFPNAEFPLVFYYTDDEKRAQLASKTTDHRCFICDLGQVRKGKSLAFDRDSIGCGGGKRYLGFTQELRPKFEYFLSCGIEGELEGERYKKSPELVKHVLEQQPPFVAPGKYIVFKRFDVADNDDLPVAVVFFATPDVLSGLFTLVGFDETIREPVIAPFGAGCATIVYFPYHESKSEHPRAVLGMFDVSARPCVPSNVLTFSIPWSKFLTMVDDMDESFLITESWSKVRGRLR